MRFRCVGAGAGLGFLLPDSHQGEDFPSEPSDISRGCVRGSMQKRRGRKREVQVSIGLEPNVVWWWMGARDSICQCQLLSQDDLGNELKTHSITLFLFPPTRNRGDPSWPACAVDMNHA